VRVDLRVPPCGSVAATVDFCVRAERAGFSGVGFVDSQLYLRDAYVVMSHVLRATQTLRVHPALTCPGPRHVSVIASAAKTVQELGPDRFELWLGRGGSASRAVGLPQLRVGEMREAITRLRALLAGEPCDFEPSEGIAEPGGERRPYFDEGFAPKMYLGGGPPVPIYLAVGGPLTGRLAGELCDGVLLCAGPSEEDIGEARRWVAEGAARAEREPRAIHEWYQMRCLVRDTREEAVRSWSPNLPAVLDSPRADEWLKKNHIDFELTDDLREAVRAVHRALRRLYPEEIHILDWEAAVRICQVIPYELQEAMADRMAVVGTPEEVRDRIRDLERLGCENLYLYPCWTFQYPEPELRAFEEVIGPSLGPRRYAPWQTMAR
jgi:5,10-methylenetetrahydromethanopterin reductase